MRTAFVALLALLLTAVPATALAVFKGATAPAALSVSSGTLGVPRSVTVPSSSTTGSVAVSWTASSGAPSGTGYYVTRKIGTTTSAACGTSASTLVTTTSCTDTVTTSGTYTYTVVAVYRLWTATSAASGSVVVTLASLGSVDFTQSPQSTKSDQTIGNVIVQLRDKSGNIVSTSGVPITLSLTGNSTGAVLSGTLTVDTGSAGNSTFTGLSVDNVGTYTLTATATNYASDVSGSFTITAGNPSKLVLVSGSPQSATAGHAFTNPLVVLVTDDEGNPVSGATVQFTVVPGASGASATFSNANTAINAISNASGDASVTVTAGTTKGTYKVTAVLGSALVNFALTNT